MTPLEFFPPEILEFNVEVSRHPQLKLIMAAAGAKTFVDKLSHAAAYVNLALEGIYSQEDAIGISGVIVLKLREKGKIIIS